MAATYDAIFIGAGLGSLTAATALANRGRRVLVLERLDHFGGAATVYRHGSLTLEAALHKTDGDTLNSPHGVFSRLALDHPPKAISPDIFYEVRGSILNDPIRVPHGLAQARDALAYVLPGARDGLHTYFKALEHLYRSLHELEAYSARGPSVLLGLLFSGRLFELIGDSRHTLLERFDHLFGDDEAAKLVLGALLAYFDDDPAQLSFLLYAGVWSRYAESGSFYFKGGSSALTTALVEHIEAREGALHRGCTVHEIVLGANDRAVGVRYRDDTGREHEALAPQIFGGASPSALAAMLPEHVRQEFSARYAGYEPSISLFNLSLGLSRPASDFGVAAYSTFVLPPELTRFADMPQAGAVFGAAPRTRMPPYAITDYGRLDARLRQYDDPYLVTLCGVDRLEWWSDLDETADADRRQRWSDALIADLDRHFPGIGDAVSQREIATARTMKNYLGTPHGEVYGFRPTPQRLFRHPPNPATPIDGLWLSSAYTVSGGYAGTMQGGLMAADAALKKAE